MNVIQNTELSYQDNKSDKVYQSAQKAQSFRAVMDSANVQAKFDS
jgi:hypothetical protein